MEEDKGYVGLTNEEFIRSITPATNVQNPYSLKTTNMMEMHDGVAWTAVLLKDGAPIGTVEDHGYGGAPCVYLKDTDEYKEWCTFLKAAYVDVRVLSREEYFVAFLTHQEDEAAKKVHDEAVQLVNEILNAEVINEENL